MNNLEILNPQRCAERSFRRGIHLGISAVALSTLLGQAAYGQSVQTADLTDFLYQS